MRSLPAVIAVAVGIWLLVTVVLPFVGMLLAAVLALAGLGALAYVAAPALARLPWFRDRIHVEEHRFGRTIRFGRVQVQQRAHARRGDDFIDVEGRTIDVEEPLLSPGDERD